MTGAVDVWSCPTVMCAGGLPQLPLVLAGRRMVLVVDARLDAHVDRVLAQGDAAEVVVLPSGGGEPDTRVGGRESGNETLELVREALARHGAAVPVALGGGSIMDVVRLAALARDDPTTTLLEATDGPRFWPSTRANPTICIPSTLGTAAEVSPIAVRSGAAGTAMLISPGLRAAAAVIDPTVTATLSAQQQASGLVEPLARVLVPAVAGGPLLLQDHVARALVDVLLALGDRAHEAEPDDGWRRTAALASVQTHTALLALDRAPAGHALWPLATELGRATARGKPAALAALVPAWLRALGDGDLGPAWGHPSRTPALLGLDASDAADRLETWLTGIRLDSTITAPTVDVDRVVDRVLRVWQASGLFLAGATGDEVSWLVRSALAG